MSITTVPKLLATITILALSVQASPFADSPSALRERIPPPVDPENCLPPRVLCDKACCTSTSTCGPTGLCKPKPGVFPPVATIEYSRDSKGRPCVVNIVGRHFHVKAEAGIQYYTPNAGFSPWYEPPIPAKDFVWNTGIQDCTKTGRPTSATDGYNGDVWVMDHNPATKIQYMKWFKIRTGTNGICP